VVLGYPTSKPCRALHDDFYDCTPEICKLWQLVICWTAVRFWVSLDRKPQVLHESAVWADNLLLWMCGLLVAVLLLWLLAGPLECNHCQVVIVSQLRGALALLGDHDCYGVVMAFQHYFDFEFNVVAVALSCSPAEFLYFAVRCV
jgi:hypothetical protein